MNINNEFLMQQWDKILNFMVNSGGKLLAAIVILWVGLRLIKLLRKALHKIMEKRSIDPSLRGFLVTACDATLKVLLVITVMSMIGIEMTSFIAILGAAGLAVGIALQGTLQNFAGGVIILILKPFKVGDFIEASGFSGSVKHIQIFHTLLATPDNKQIIIPNSELATKSIINYTKSDIRRVDITVSIAYGESVDQTRDILLNIAKADSRVLTEPDLPVVVVSSLSDNSIHIALRMWVKTADYWGVMGGSNEKIYQQLNIAQISNPQQKLQIEMTAAK